MWVQSTDGNLIDCHAFLKKFSPGSGAGESKYVIIGVTAAGVTHDLGRYKNVHVRDSIINKIRHHISKGKTEVFILPDDFPNYNVNESQTGRCECECNSNIEEQAYDGDGDYEAPRPKERMEEHGDVVPRYGGGYR